MGFTFEELGNMWGKVCSVDEVVQIPSKCFDDLGENMRNLLDEIAAEWFGTPTSANGVLVDDLSLDESVADFCEISEDGFDENIHNETLLTCIGMESTACPLEELIPFTSPSVAQDDLDLRSIFSDHSKISVSTTDPGNEVLSGIHQNKLIVELKSLECTSPNNTYGLINLMSETSTPQESVSHMKSRDEDEEQTKPCNLEFLVQPQQLAFPEISYNFMRDNMFNSIDKINLKTEIKGEFGDLDQGCWDDDEDYDLALASYHECKKRPYKIKLQSSFLSKLIRRKENERAHDVYHGIHMGTQELQEITPSSPSKITVSHDSLESDWELL
ncbi:uncharacterized protein [Typha latifolia]|uniref:uncharacterized protein n=1 Tax=Typha latifolia TaxID=4733 RepID=UPI003C2FF501